MNQIYVISAPSGAGKSTILKRVLETNPQLTLSVSCTTRKPRPGEQHGREYYFLEKEDFKNKIEQNDFLEYAQVFDNFYGTLKSEIDRSFSEGKSLILEIDVQGARLVREALKDSPLKEQLQFIFITPPSLEILEKRLRDRGTETEEIIQKRLSEAAGEMSAAPEYDEKVINHDLDQAVAQMKTLLSGE